MDPRELIVLDIEDIHQKHSQNVVAWRYRVRSKFVVSGMVSYEPEGGIESGKLNH